LHQSKGGLCENLQNDPQYVERDVKPTQLAVLFLGGQTATEADIEQQQYELIAGLEQSFRELVASNSALCCRLNGLEQLILHRGSVCGRQAPRQQPGKLSSCLGADAAAAHCIGSGSHRQASCRTRSNVEETVDVVDLLPKSHCTRRRSEEIRNRLAEKNVSSRDEIDDVWMRVPDQPYRWRNVSDLSDSADVLCRTSTDICEYLPVISLVT